jgi:NhaP-type Na+/H+ or K+/H+ antiporter
MTALFSHMQETILLLVGLILLIGFYMGKGAGKIKLPSIIGFMLFGLLAGPSCLNLLNNEIQHNLGFVTEIALGFVAFSIGLELSFNSLKKQGIGIISIILVESILAFIVVTAGIYFLTNNMKIALAFGALAPASAPAGTVAVIKEYRASGSLTKALYAVVGFDDGLAIIIFGFSAAAIRMMFNAETGTATTGIGEALWVPMKEIILSLGIGGVAAIITCLMLRKVRSAADTLTLVVGVVLVVNGLCQLMHLSLILTNMVIGMVIINTQPRDLAHRIGEQLSGVMPLMFILFFTLAGAHLQVSALPTLGWLGVVYIACRTMGLMGGAAIGGSIGKVEPKLKKYVGMGILSQAGVAIGLALILNRDFAGVGKIVDAVTGRTTGDELGTMVITTITATCIFFEIIGPILTRIALTKAGEINQAK